MLYSVIIPAYNEAQRLPKTLDEIKEFFNRKRLSEEIEIIVIVEKSTDNTLDIVKSYANRCKNVKYLENDKRYGKGYSIKKGVAASIGDYILFTDSDLSVPIEYACKMKNIMDLFSADCCIGERIQIKKQPLYRRFMGACFRLLVHIITGVGYKDTQCGFKMFNRAFADNVFPEMKINDFAFDVEMLMIGKTMGYKTKSVRVPWYNNKNSKVSPIKDSIKMFRDLFIIRSRCKGQD